MLVEREETSKQLNKTMETYTWTMKIPDKKKRPIKCKNSLNFGHLKKYCHREKEYCEKYARSWQQNTFVCQRRETMSMCKTWNTEWSIKKIP